MKAILLDLDNTLFATNCCSVYLRSRAGRRDVCGLIRNNELEIRPLDEQIPSFLNKLEKHDGVDVYIISDSPKDYCITILERFCVNIDPSRVYGSMHKPCIESEFEEIFSEYDELLVVGDTPKDIYLAHRLEAASIFVTCLTNYDINFSVNNSMPTEVARSFYELEQFVIRFLEEGIEYKSFFFKPHFLTVDPDAAEIIDIAEENIGFAMKYIPDLDDITDPNDKFIWFKIHRSIKPAKYLSATQLNNKVKVSFYNNNKSITEGVSFKDVAWHARLEFAKWLREKNIRGKVYLVAAPSSVPRECNNSLPMEILVRWWVKWIKFVQGHNAVILNGNYVERFWPTAPAHMSKGRREVRPHFKTLGVFNDAPPFAPDTSAIIIVDDVVTSGTQMKAIASLLHGTGKIPRGVPVYGYALAKTTRINNHIDFNKLLEAFSKAEKSGG